MSPRYYGSLNISQGSPYIPPVEPMSLKEAKQLIRVDFNDEDALIDKMIKAARVAAEKATGLHLAVKQYDLTLDQFTYRDIQLPVPLQAVDLFQYKDYIGNVTEMTEGTNHIVDLARGVIVPPYGQFWPQFTPWPSSAVLIRFRVGYPRQNAFWDDEGNAIMLGMRFLVNDWWSNRDMFAAGGGEEFPYRTDYLFGTSARSRAR